ncbi:MAG: hypothetical protein EOM56_00005, partial [Deltaproteobacteria bacterium]|nr:hypothetical protein [Deltaproteobacteria bacterium]
MDQDRKAAAPPSSPTPDSGGAAFGPGNKVGRSSQSPKKRKNWLRLAVWALASCVLLCVLVIAGALVALRNEGVQGWLTDKINAALEAAPPDRAAAQGSAAGSDGSAVPGGASPAIRARITHLSGALPFEFALGVELYDAQGLWLRLPACSARWNWQALPGVLHIAFVRVDNVELLRLPLLPQEATPPPAPVLSEAGLRTALADALRGLDSLPGWLPQVRVDELSLNNAQMPQALLGQ